MHELRCRYLPQQLNFKVSIWQISQRTFAPCIRVFVITLRSMWAMCVAANQKRNATCMKSDFYLDTGRKFESFESTGI